MGVFARLLRRSGGSPRKPAAGAAPAHAGADRKAGEEKATEVTGAGEEPEEVGIPKQQSADGAADSESSDDARN